MSATIERTRQLAEKVKDMDDSREGREELDRFIHFEQNLDGVFKKLRGVAEAWEVLEQDMDYPFDESKRKIIQRKIKTKKTNFNKDPAQAVKAPFRLDDFFTVLESSRNKLLAKWQERFESAIGSAKEKIQHLQVIPQPGQEAKLSDLEEEVDSLETLSEKLPSSRDEVEEAKELVKDVEELIGKLGQGGEISSEKKDQYEFLTDSKIGMPGYSLRKLLEKESLRKWLLKQDFLGDYKIKKTR
jgi:hypothetical protein